VRRLFWLGLGIAVGAIVVRQVARAAHAYTPAGMAESARNSAAGIWGSVQDFVADVRDGMAEREEQIRDAFLRGEAITDLDEETDDYDYER
jgi:hypothetical protein